MSHSKIQIKPSINSKLEQMLREESTRRKKPYGFFVNEALEQYFDPDSVKVREAILLKRIDQMEIKLLTLNNNLNILSESFAIYIKTYFSRLVDIPKEQIAAVESRSNKLFQQFLKQVHSSCTAGNNLFNDLPKDDFVAEEDAEKIMQEFNKEFKNELA